MRKARDGVRGVKEMRSVKEKYITIIPVMVLLLVAAAAALADVDEKVKAALEENQEVPVIVMLKESTGEVQDHLLEDLILKDESYPANQVAVQQQYDFDIEREYVAIPGFSGELTAEGLEKLENDPRVEGIYLDKIYQIMLDGSVPQINAHAVWNISVAGYNITGKGETVCILDTGIDTDHSAFQDKIKSQYCYCSGDCCPGGSSAEENAEDDHGHGSHVAGIAAGNLTTYTGVAKDAGIYAVKVCDSAGFCATSDIIAGMDRCSETGNLTAFNISVISLSLGDSSQNNEYCNNDALAPAINAAVGKNISVVIAAGNNGYTSGISSPACVQNSTPVGAVDDSDAILYNRGRILQLLAPGFSVTSANLGGGTATLSGTSMSAPHLSGSIALFRQYWRLAYGRIPTVDEIKRKLMISGKGIDDTGSAQQYSRIDVATALQPFLNFSGSLDNNSHTRNDNVLITIIADVPLSAAMLEWSYDNGSRTNLSMLSVNETLFYLNLTHLRDGADTYVIYGNDTAGTAGISAQRTLTTDLLIPLVIITNPANGSAWSGVGMAAFNATVSEKYIDTVLFKFSNSSGNDFNVSPTNASGNWNSNIDLSRLAEGLQSLSVFANDSAGNVNSTPSVEFTIDRMPPAVSIISPANGQNYTLASGEQIFNISATDALLSVSTLQLNFDNASGKDFTVIAAAAGQPGYWAASYNFSALSAGTHKVTIVANDSVGNSNNTGAVTFSVDTATLQVSLHTPVNENQNSSGVLLFNCSAQDYLELANLTLYGNWNAGWHANETKTIAGNRSSATFSRTLPDGTYAWNCLAYDTHFNSALAQSNFSVTIDTTAPVISSVSPGTPASTSATITWSTNEEANATVDYGATAALGTISSTTTRSTSPSRTLSSLSAATTYFYNITSCDRLGNCRTNGTFSFITAAAAGSGESGSSAGAAGGGGGGGGGSSPAASSTSTAGSKDKEESSFSVADSAVKESATASRPEAETDSTLPPVTFSQAVSFLKYTANVVAVDEEKIGIRQIEINPKVDKETTLSISYLPEKPADIPEIRNSYQYFEVNVDLRPEEIREAVMTLEIPRAWLEQNNFLKETVALNVLEEGKWRKLATKFIEENEDVLRYQAKVRHFSYFAITAHSELESSWFRNLIPPRLGSRGFVLFGMVMVIAFLLMLYWFIHRGEGKEDRV